MGGGVVADIAHYAGWARKSMTARVAAAPRPEGQRGNSGPSVLWTPLTHHLEDLLPARNGAPVVVPGKNRASHNYPVKPECRILLQSIAESERPEGVSNGAEPHNAVKSKQFHFFQDSHDDIARSRNYANPIADVSHINVSLM